MDYKLLLFIYQKKNNLHCKLFLCIIYTIEDLKSHM